MIFNNSLKNAFFFRVMQANEGKAPATYRQFIKLVSSMKPPPTPVPHVSAKIKNCGITPISEDHDDLWSVPTLAELGFDTNHVPPPKWPGGKQTILLCTFIYKLFREINIQHSYFSKNYF